MVEEIEGAGKGALRSVGGGVEVAAVGEGVGGDIEDAQDEGSAAESEGAGAEAPVEDGARSHEGILFARFAGREVMRRKGGLIRLAGMLCFGEGKSKC